MNSRLASVETHPPLFPQKSSPIHETNQPFPRRTMATPSQNRYYTNSLHLRYTVFFATIYSNIDSLF